MIAKVSVIARVDRSYLCRTFLIKFSEQGVHIRIWHVPVDFYSLCIV